MKRPLDTIRRNQVEQNEYSQLARQWVKCQKTILAFLSSLVYDDAEVEELLQETAARVFAEAHRFDVSRPFLPWALGIARHVVLKHRARISRDRHLFDSELIENLAEAFAEVSEKWDVLQELLPDCRDRLPTRYREVCRLRYEEELTPTSIARRLGKSVGAVSTMLSRLRDQLRDCLERRLRSEGYLA